MRIRVLASLVVPFLFVACAHSKPPVTPPVNPSEITEEEIAGTSAANAYEVIRKLRGNFFSFRGRTTLIGSSNPDPTVFVDELQYGTLNTLRTIPTSQIATIRLYRAWEAASKYGTGHMGGVIAVTTKQ